MRRQAFVGAAVALLAFGHDGAAAWAQFHHHHHGGGHPGGSFFLFGAYPWYGPTYFGYGPVLNSAPPWRYGPAPMSVAPAVPRMDEAPAPEKASPAGGGFGELAGGEAKNAERPKIRVSNAESVARARRFIAFGDQHFRTQKFSDAYQRYKKAAAAAPDLADAYFRQGFSLLAMGQYVSAARAVKHGLSLKPDWPQSNFRSDELYGDNRLAKVAHLEQLAAEATEHPRNADLMFLLGVRLYFDDQGERSRLFFQRAGQLGADREAIAGFLKAAPASVAGDQPAGREL